MGGNPCCWAHAWSHLCQHDLFVHVSLAMRDMDKAGVEYYPWNGSFWLIDCWNISLVRPTFDEHLYRTHASSHLLSISSDLFTSHFPKYLSHHFPNRVPYKSLIIHPNHCLRPMNLHTITHVLNAFPSIAMCIAHSFAHHEDFLICYSVEEWRDAATVHFRVLSAYQVVETICKVSLNLLFLGQQITAHTLCNIRVSSEPVWTW